MNQPPAAALFSAALFPFFAGIGDWIDATRSDFSVEVRIELLGQVDLPLQDWQVILLDGRNRWKTGVLQREGGVFVAQFQALPDRLPDGLTLAVADQDGFRFGATPLSDGWLELSAPVPLEVRATGTVRSEIQWEPTPAYLEGQWSPENPSISILSVEEGSPVDSYRLSRWKWLEPGTYLARSMSRDYKRFEQKFQVFAGEVSVMRGWMNLAEQPRVVHGEAWSQDGSELGGFLVALRDPNDTRDTWAISRVYNSGFMSCDSGRPSTDAWLSLQEGDSSRGSFLLPRVSSNNLEPVLLSCEFPMEIALLELPGGDFKLQVIQLDPLGSGIGFRTPPDAPGLGLQENLGYSTELDWRLTTRIRDGGPPIQGFAADGTLCTQVDPREREFDWALDASGFQPIYGDESSFVEESPGRFFATVVPVKGFGLRVFARDSAGGPVSRAAVKSAGEELGMTNRRGWLDVDRWLREVDVRDEQGRVFTGTGPFLLGSELYYGVVRFPPWLEVVLEKPDE